MALDLSVYQALSFYPRGENFTGVITNSCDSPWKTLSINFEGRCFICKCDAHLPVPVGNICDFSKLEDVWLNDRAKEIQQTILDKKFTYCAVSHCGIRERSIHNPVYDLSINVDESCNLACPSCRKDLINHTSGDLFNNRLHTVNHIVDLVNNFTEPLHLTMSGNGDPLASLIMRPLVLNWIPKSNQSIKLFTNGLLMKKLLPDSPIFPYIKEYQISVDAGSADVYELVRHPGKFSVLQDNLNWLSDNTDLNTNVNLMFTLSALNAKDIVNFSEMCKNYNFKGVITKLEDWRTFDDFNSMDVVNSTHPLHNEAMQQLRQVAQMPHIEISPYFTDIL